MIARPSPGTVLRLRLEGWGRLGEALARYGDHVVFVSGGIPGEEVEARIVGKGRRYLSARVESVLESSPMRVKAPCPYYGQCTGCQWQHISYPHTLQIKRQIVADALIRIGGFEDPPVVETVPAPQQFGYRNHARFTVGPEGSLGFVNRQTREFIPIQHCMLMADWINHALEQLQGRCGETTQLSVRYGTATGDYLVQPALKNSEVPLPSGQKHYHERLDSHLFQVSSPSFFQVNTLQASRLVGEVRNALGLSGKELLIDAYAGIGTFAIMLAPYCHRVIAIEESSAAIEDARVNTRGIENLQLLHAKTEEVLDSLEERPDCLVLDPPRAGCHPKVMESLGHLGPSRIVYVSCDPSTMARDLKRLCAHDLYLVQVQPVDMFPQTHHIECLALLRRTNEASDMSAPIVSSVPVSG